MPKPPPLHRAVQRLGDELPAARVTTESRPPAAAVQTTLTGGRRVESMVNRRLRPASSIALLDNRLSIAATCGWKAAIAHGEKPSSCGNEPPTGRDDRPEQKTEPLSVDGDTADQWLLRGVRRRDSDERDNDNEHRRERVAA